METKANAGATDTFRGMASIGNTASEDQRGLSVKEQNIRLTTAYLSQDPVNI